MPGILPMKVIRVGTSAQSRIAQACDRCRSKKIRCDGVTPCCSQCSNVGFECKTSDKLSRRAFPRGYTESLEDRVRTLEGDVKELKDLLEKKDEQIDILSRIRPNPNLHERPDPPGSLPSVLEDKPANEKPADEKPADEKPADEKPADEKPKAAEDVFKVQYPPYLLSSDYHDTVFMGASSSISFVDAFKTKLGESDRFCYTFKPEIFFGPYQKVTPPLKCLNPMTNHEISKAPPRLVSDQMVNIFCQEWAPLFPVLHRPTFLNLYDKYMKNPEEVDDHHSVAQLNLVFGIAALSAEWNQQDADEFERQWQTAIDTILHDISLPTLQCLVLAQIYCIVKADYSKLMFYKGVAIVLSYQLGLHQSQKNIFLGALATETRKKVFWVLYTLDCFSAAMLGLPKLINESHIHVEYPSDVDDENLSEQGFQSTQSGEPTRLSSALALFRVARILSKVLDEVYSAEGSHELSLERTNALNEELGVWLQSLAPQHRLKFVQEKPSTDIVGSRSPLLSLAYHYVRILIHRPALGSNVGAKLSLMNLATSSKYIIQIAQLLEERRMSFSFCLNMNELLLVAGFGLLFQGLDLNRKGKWIQDSQRLVTYAIDVIDRNGGPGTEEFRELASSMINGNRDTKAVQSPKTDSRTRRKSDSGIPTSKAGSKSARKQLQEIASRFSNPSRTMKQEKLKSSRQPKLSAPDSLACNPHFFDRNESQNSVSSVVSDPTAEQEYLNAVSSLASCQAPLNGPPNYDFLVSQDLVPYFSVPSMTSEHLTKVSDYGLVTTQQANGPPCENIFNSSPVLNTYMSVPQSAYDWPAEVWGLPSDLQGNPHSTHSVLSLSEEEVTSGEELSICDQTGEFQGILMPTVDGYGSLDGFEGYRL